MEAKKAKISKKGVIFVLLILFSAALFARITPEWFPNLNLNLFTPVKPTEITERSKEKTTEKISEKTEKTEKRQDEMLVKCLQQQIKETKFLSSLNIVVHCNRGFISLFGETDSNEQVNTMVLLFMGTTGVKDVDVRGLHVQHKPVQNQDVVVAKVNGVLMREQILEKNYVIKPIEVYAEHGNVTLLGIVERQKQEHDIINLVKTVNGVHDVSSKIISLDERHGKN